MRSHWPSDGIAYVPTRLAKELGRSDSMVLYSLYQALRTAGFSSKGQTWVTWSISDIAEATGLCWRTTISALHRLRDSGLIASSVMNDNPFDRTMSYTILPAGLDKLSSTCNIVPLLSRHADMSDVPQSTMPDMPQSSMHDVNDGQSNSDILDYASDGTKPPPKARPEGLFEPEKPPGAGQTGQNSEKAEFAQSGLHEISKNSRGLVPGAYAPGTNNNLSSNTNNILKQQDNNSKSFSSAVLSLQEKLELGLLEKSNDFSNNLRAENFANLPLPDSQTAAQTADDARASPPVSARADAPARADGGSPTPQDDVPRDAEGRELTPAGAYYFKAFRRKRWATPVQKESFESAEREVGSEAMIAAVKWAAELGTSNVHAIITAARKRKSRTRAAPAAGSGNGIAGGFVPPLGGKRTRGGEYD